MTKSPKAPPEVLDTAGVSAYLGIHKQHIWRLVKRGELPPGQRLGSREVYWLRSACERYLERVYAGMQLQTELVDRSRRETLKRAKASTRASKKGKK